MIMSIVIECSVPLFVCLLSFLLFILLFLLLLVSSRYEEFGECRAWLVCVSVPDRMAPNYLSSTPEHRKKVTSRTIIKRYTYFAEARISKVTNQ